MHIALDTSLTRFIHLGSAVYSSCLARALDEICTEGSSNLELTSCNIPGFMHELKNSYIRKLAAAYWQIVHTSLIVPLHALRFDCDIIHYTTPVPVSQVKPKPIVISIMDIIPLVHPELWHSKGISNQRIKVSLTRAVQRADHIIAISEATKRDIIQYFGVPESRITTTLLGPGLDLPWLDDKQARQYIYETFNFAPGYVLCVGSQAPNKNLRLVAGAYNTLRRRGVDLPPLVITGAPLGSQSEFQEAVERYDLQPYVKFTGFVSEMSLAALYRCAGVFVFPSLYEGFGLVVLEAMRCGCPVITSNSSSLPEVAGDAALMIDPSDENELAEAISFVLYTSGIAEKMRNQSLEHVKKFSWRRCANETIGAYHKTLHSVKVSTSNFQRA